MLAVLDLVIDRLGIPRKGDDLAIALGWQRDRGSGLGRRAREWIDRRHPPPQGYSEVLHMLGEAGLLQPEAEAAWRGISLGEAVRAVEAQRIRLAKEAADRRKAQSEESLPAQRRSGRGSA